MKFNNFIMAGLISLVLVLIALPLCSALGEVLSYAPNETMELNIKCYDTDSKLCNSATQCEMDIFYPNMSLFLFNVSMTRNGTFFNYTAPNTPTLGVYKVSTFCHDAITNGYSNFDFYVGYPSTDVQQTSTSIAIIVLIIIGVVLFVSFFLTQSIPFKWSFFLFGLLFFVIALNVVSISLTNEAGSENIRNIFDQLGAICYYIYWFIGGLLLMIWIFTTIASISDRQRMKQAEEVGAPTDFI